MPHAAPKSAARREATIDPPVKKRDSIPLSVCIVVSIVIHVMVLAPSIGSAMRPTKALEAGIDDPEEDATKRDDRAAPEEQPNPLARVMRPTEIERVQLGIDDGSDQPLVTWIGYDEYQEHLARRSEVEQAAMRMSDAGGGEPAAAPPGAMSLAPPMTTPPPPDGPPTPVTAVDRSADTGQLARARPAAPPSPQPPNAPPAPERATESPEPAPTPPFANAPSPPLPTARPALEPPLHPPTRPAAPPPDMTRGAATTPPAPAPGLALPRPADPPTAPDGNPLPPEPQPGEAAKPDPIVRPADDRGPPDATPREPAPESSDSPPRPVPEPPRDAEPTPPPASATPPSMAPSRPEPTPPAPQPEDRSATSPADLETAPPHHEPERDAPPSPPARPEGAPAQPASDAPGAPTRPAATPGPPVDGELSDRESDATSTVDVPADRWKNGKPLAAKGLQILTRRPEMLPEYLAVQIGPAKNPVFELHFDHRGVVRKVVMQESSGVSQLDDRLIDCLYKWRARGARLAQVKADDRLKLSMRMLVR